MSIDLVLTYTSKPMFSQEGYRVYDKQIKSFKDFKEAKDYLKEEFYYCKTVKPMYRDRKDGTYYKSGQIYCYNETQHNRDGTTEYLNIQVWIAWYDVHTKAIDFDSMKKKSKGFKKDFQEVYNQ